MMIIFYLMVFMSILQVFSETNPVKTSMKLIVLSSMGFLSMTMMTYNMTLALIFVMIFMGGIILMFMLLSSTLPNEQAFKEKFPTMIFFVVILSLAIFTTPVMSSQPSLSISWFQLSEGNNSMAIALMILYFLVMDTLISNCNFPMRNFSC